MGFDGDWNHSREAHRLATCEGKQQFDRPTANRVARETTKVKLSPYKCSCCGHWHIGTAPENLGARNGKKRKKPR